jgi:hypothetical protein
MEISAEGGDITSTVNQVSPLGDYQSTLKLPRVEVVELSEISSECIELKDFVQNTISR